MVEEIVLKLDVRLRLAYQFGRSWLLQVCRKTFTSQFGIICEKQINFEKSVVSIMYKPLPLLKRIEYGKLNETVAVEAYASLTMNTVVCLERGYGFLGASPDGLVGDNKIFEVK